MILSLLYEKYSCQNPLLTKVPYSKRGFLCPVHRNITEGITHLLEITFRCSSWRSNVARAQSPPYTATLLGDNSYRERERQRASCHWLPKCCKGGIEPSTPGLSFKQWQDQSLSNAVEALRLLSPTAWGDRVRAVTLLREQTSISGAFGWLNYKL